MNLNVPGFKIYKLKQYQHRTKHRHETGYTGKITQNGRIHIQKNWYTTISVRDAYIVGCKNVGTKPASIVFNFSVFTKTGQKVDTFSRSTTTLQPGHSSEIAFDVNLDKAFIKLDSVDVMSDGAESVHTPVKRSIPGMVGIKASLIALLLAFVAAMSLTEPHTPNASTVVLPFIALTTFTLTILNRTPIWLMFLFVILTIFSGYAPQQLGTILIIAVAYLVLVWNKRGSVKDFLYPYSTPWYIL